MHHVRVRPPTARPTRPTLTQPRPPRVEQRRCPVRRHMSTEVADDALEAVPGLSLTRTSTRGFKFDESVQSFWKAVEQDKWVLAATHFDKIRRHSVPPADAYSTAPSAPFVRNITHSRIDKMLEHTARWLPIESTLQMFNDMRTSGVQPDLNTYKIRYFTMHLVLALLSPGPRCLLVQHIMIGALGARRELNSVTKVRRIPSTSAFVCYLVRLHRCESSWSKR